MSVLSLPLTERAMTDASINSDSRVDLADTINATITQHPSSLRVFHSFGIHTCCDGGLSLETAAAKAKVDPQLLLELLTEAISAEGQA